MATSFRPAVSLASVAALGFSVSLALPVSAQAASSDVNLAIIGDSFTSGNGAGYYTDEVDCYQSTKNYGHVLAGKLRGQGHAVNVTDYSCSGSSWRHVSSKRRMAGQHSRTVPANIAGDKAKAKKYLLSAGACRTGTPGQLLSNSLTVQSFSGNTARYKCQGTIKPMAQAMNANTDVVVLTMGLNDLGYGALVHGCMVDGTTTSQCNDAVKAAQGKLKHLEKQTTYGLDKLYGKGNLNDNARVVLVGVPLLATDSTAKGKALRGLANQINDAQIAGVKRFDSASGKKTTYLDTRAMFAGHEIDLREGTANPSGWITDQGQPGGIVGEWFHPSATGHAQLGAKLASMNLVAAPVSDQPEPTTPATTPAPTTPATTPAPTTPVATSTAPGTTPAPTTPVPSSTAVVPTSTAPGTTPAPTTTAVMPTSTATPSATAEPTTTPSPSPTATEPGDDNGDDDGNWWSNPFEAFWRWMMDQFQRWLDMIGAK